MKRCFSAFVQSQRVACRRVHTPAANCRIRSATPTTTHRLLNAKSSKPKALPKSKYEWSLVARARRKVIEDITEPTDARTARAMRATELDEALNLLIRMTGTDCRMHQASSSSGAPENPTRALQHSALVVQVSCLTRSKHRDTAEVLPKIDACLQSAQASNEELREAYGLAIGYATKLRNFAWLRRLTKAFVARGLSLNTRIMNATLGLFAAERSLQRYAHVLRIFSDVGLQADISTWNQFLTICEPDERVRVFAKFQALEILPNHVTQAIMMPLWRSQHASAFEFIQSFKAADWTPSLGDILLAMLVREGLFLMAHGLVMTSGVLQISSRGAATLLEGHLDHVKASSLGRSVKYRRILALQDHLLDKGIKFSPRMYHTLMKIAIKLRKRVWYGLLRESYELQCQIEPHFAKSTGKFRGPVYPTVLPR